MTRTPIAGVWLILVLFCFFLRPGFAFICTGGQINIGDSTVKILDKCGEPQAKQTIGQTREGISAEPGASGGIKEWSGGAKAIEQWIYIDIPYHHDRHVIMTFEGGMLVDIKEEVR
ncbi:MAG TPA: DUF2845 domain-containing protein [Desulfatiglandales bacterium]|nr:DUF2845 domain-containing protein [Desulfatiglandales bacterium]